MYYLFCGLRKLDMIELEACLNIVTPEEFIFETINDFSGYFETGISISDILINKIDLINSDLGQSLVFLSSPIYNEMVVNLLYQERKLLNSNYICLADLCNLALMNGDTNIVKLINQSFEMIDAEIMNSVIYYVKMGCNVIKASKYLYIHRNTMNYRLNKFMNQSGFDLRDNEHVQYIYLYGVIKNAHFVHSAQAE